MVQKPSAQRSEIKKTRRNPARSWRAREEKTHVKGDTRYMKIQNLGKAEGLARTPQKMRVREKSKLAMLPAVSADSIPAMTIEVNVEVKRRNSWQKRKKRAPRSCTELVGMAFL